MRKTALVSILLCLAAVTPVAGETYPRSEDVATLDGILRAYYEVVSGPAGQPRQWERDRSLHHPGALVTVVEAGEDGSPEARVMTLAKFHERSEGLTAGGFWEHEIDREVDRHGAVAHVWSTYEWRTAEDGPAGGRGVNSIQLFHDGKRWWITSWIFDARRDLPPPEEPAPSGG